MADARTLLKLPDEMVGAFNKRLMTACEEAQVTDVALHVIDGQPMITLFSEIIEASEEDVADAKEDGDNSLKVGDAIPEEPPVVVQICRVSCESNEAAAKSQERLEKLFARAQAGVTKLLKDSGAVSGFIQGPDKKPVAATTTFHYVAVVSLADVDEDEDAEGADQQMEQTLRSET